MQSAGIMEEERAKIQPYGIGVETEPPVNRPKLTLKYLQGLIETLQEDHHKLSERVDELSKLLENEKNTRESHGSFQWSVAVIPAAAASEGRLQSGADPIAMDSILLELQEAARIADEITEHAAAASASRPVPIHPGPADGTTTAAASDAAAPTMQPPGFSPIMTSRAERHQKRKPPSFWSKLFGRASR